MHQAARHIRNLVVALAILSLSAGTVFAARPSSTPPLAATAGLALASMAAGKTVPVRPTVTEVEPDGPEVDEPDLDTPDGEGSDGEREHDHGWYVSQAAKGATPAEAKNHGAHVSAVARGDDGKSGRASKAPRVPRVVKDPKGQAKPDKGR